MFATIPARTERSVFRCPVDPLLSLVILSMDGEIANKLDEHSVGRHLVSWLDQPSQGEAGKGLRAQDRCSCRRVRMNGSGSMRSTSTWIELGDSPDEVTSMERVVSFAGSKGHSTDKC